MHELRGAPEPELAQLLGKLAPVDLVLVEGFKREPHPKLEVYRAVVGKPCLYHRRSRHRRDRLRSPDAGGADPLGAARGHAHDCRYSARKRDPGRGGDRADGASMAQLSDDCFAFSGPLMPIAEMERLILERVATGGRDRTHRPAGGGGPRARERSRRGDRPAAVRQLGRRRLCAAPCRSRCARGYASCGRRPDRRRPGRGARHRCAARRSASSRARRCRRAPTPSSCRRTCGSTATASSCRPDLAAAPIHASPAKIFAPVRSCFRRDNACLRRTWPSRRLRA